MRELGVSASLYMIATLHFFLPIPERSLPLSLVYMILLCFTYRICMPCNVLQAAYLAAMQNVTTSYRSAYNDLLKVYRESDEAEEKGRVLSMWLFNHY